MSAFVLKLYQIKRKAGDVVKNFINQTNEICSVAKLVIKTGTILSILLLICAFFSVSYNIEMCTTGVYLFSESIIAGLIFDVVDKRRG